MSDPNGVSPPRVLPPHYFFTGLILLFALAFAPGPKLFPSPWQHLGWLLIVLGLAVAIRGNRQFHAVGTNVIPLSESTVLVTDGVFAISRNPMYTGMIAVQAGIAVLINKPWPWLVVIGLAVVLCQVFIRKEETLLETTFGESYRRYKTQTRRWL